MTTEIILLAPRGFCAGVARAIDIVERALEKYGTPLYVKHEIVHNRTVVEDFKKRGVKFIEDVTEVPCDSRIIFSAHGVSKQVEELSRKRNLHIIDASCPLVKKVHREVSKYDSIGAQIILIGHVGHPELEGTSGRVEGYEPLIVETVEDAKNIQPDPSALANQKLALATQTTLSLDDTQAIVNTLVDRFPFIEVKNDICYATQNRQVAIKEVAQKCDLILVVGSKESSNANRLVQIAEEFCPSFLIENASQIPDLNIGTPDVIGLSAGASTPEFLVEEVIKYFNSLGSDVKVREWVSKIEDVVFYTPKELRS